MKILVIGNGGREHALVWKLAQSDRVDKIYCAPGNGGIAEIAECIDIDINDFESLTNFVRYEWIDLTVVGPEAPLVKGIVDVFQKEGLMIFGPDRKNARLEGSKVFAKDFMKCHNIPTAEYKAFTSFIHAQEHVRLKGAPLVIKADGLAAGKGVFVSSTTDEAIEALNLIMKERIFGTAGDRVIIEEKLQGQEASMMVITDGETIIPLASSQDHKQIFDGDTGPNTGGMGAYSPAPVINKTLEKEIMNTIVIPAIRGMKKEGMTYKGVLYAGLMIDNNKPFVLEFNCRFGDPEAQVVLTRLESDLLDMLTACAKERLRDINVLWKNDASVCVVGASEGYPGPYKKGYSINGLDMIKKMDNIVVFHAGTTIGNNHIVTSGGRVIGVTALGANIKEAIKRAYQGIEAISWQGIYYRKDIGFKALKESV
jgi:phosphoribosylamine--glycine ligase